MKYTLLGNELKISTIALGTDVYGTVVDEKTAFSLLDFYFDRGGNLIDTANAYADWIEGGKGASEMVIGRWLKNRRRDKVIISTKGGFPLQDSMNVSRLSRKDIFADMDESLLRLGTDYVDIYWLHRDDVTLPVGEIMEYLNELVRQGKTRFIGMSNWSCGRIDEANRYAAEHNLMLLSASQIQYSMAVANPEKNDPTLVLMNDNEYNYFKNHDMTVFAFASQAKGFFSKMYSGGIEALSPKARDRYLNEKTLARYERIKEIAEKYERTVGEVSLSALVSNSDFDTVAIVGCKNLAQLEDSLGAWGFKMNDEDVKYIFEGM